MTPHVWFLIILSFCVCAAEKSKRFLFDSSQACDTNHVYQYDSLCYIRDTNHRRCLMSCSRHQTFDPQTCTCQHSSYNQNFKVHPCYVASTHTNGIVYNGPYTTSRYDVCPDAVPSAACTEKHVFPGDQRCYVTLYNGIQMVRACQAYETFDEQRCDCRFHDFDQVYTSDTCRQAAYSGGVQYHPPTTSTDHNCQQNTAYNDLLNVMQGSPCTSMDSTWIKVYNLLGPTIHKSETCGKIALNELKNHYTRRSNITNCVCDNQRPPVPENSLESGQYIKQLCDSHDHPYYQELYDGVFKAGSNGKRVCVSHSEVWPKLDLINDDTCLVDLLRHTKAAFIDFNHTPCHCSEETHTTVTTSTTHLTHSTTVQSHSSHDCEAYPEYRFFEDLIAHDRCMSQAEGWSKLKTLQDKSVHCRITIIQNLKNKFRHSQSPSWCTCSSTFERFHWTNTGYYATCTHEHDYHNLVTILSHQNTCKTHHSIWSVLSAITHQGGGRYAYCQRDAVNHAAVAEDLTKNRCTCWATNSSASPTTTLPTSTITFLHPTMSSIGGMVHDVYECRNHNIDEAVTNGLTLSTASLNCHNGQASTELFVSRNCNVTDSSTWIRGYKILENCGRIPKFSLIGAFASHTYTHDGIVGSLVECSNDTIKMATMDCNKNIGIVTIDNTSRDTYTHVADNFYTISE